MRAALLVGAALRVCAAFFAEDVWGDAPVRLELVGRWIQDPGLWWDATRVFQYGPLPTNVAGLASLVLGLHWGPRLCVLVAGIAAIPLAARLAGRVSGEGAGRVAAFAIAVSPLHLQASTTFASEAIYVAAVLWAVERALAGRLVAAALGAFIAATTRYDAWLWLPALALLWMLAQRARPLRALGGAVLFALGPLSILGANLVAGDMLAPVRHVSAEHLMLAQTAQAQWGTVPWRLAMALWWPAAIVLVLTPGFAGLLALQVVRAVRERAVLLPGAAAGIPPAIYATRAVVFGSFWPMARFALGPAALLLAYMRAAPARVLLGCIGVACAFSLGIQAAGAWLPNPLGMWAAASAPVSRMPDDLRAATEALRAHGCADAWLETSPHYEEIVVAHNAGCDRFAMLPTDGALPSFVLAVRGRALEARLGDAYERLGDVNTMSWWRRR